MAKPAAGSSVNGTGGVIDTAPADRAADLLDLVAAGIDRSQDDRRPGDDIVRAFADRGLLRILAPREYGGEEASGRDFLELVETVATVDGSAAWTVMTLNEEMEIACAHLPPEYMASVVRSDPPIVVAGAGAPQGTAVRAEGGWRLTGQWAFVTGGPAADFIVVGAVAEGPRPRSLCYVLVPRQEVDILDTWDTVGLRGTGSHDVRLDSVFVPDERVGLSAGAGLAIPDSPLFRLPFGLRFPFPKVGVAAGVARAAIESFTELAATKRARLGKALLRDEVDAQIAVAEAEALLCSGRAFATEMLDTVWALAVEGESIPERIHARTRLACSTSVANSVRAVELLATAAGTTVNRRGHPLQRQLADVRAVPQHFMVGGYHRLSAGRVLLGMRADDPMF
ncbi:MAG: acyl-CoA dehydrogenase family protein [Acidimicrobiales bacterium]